MRSGPRASLRNVHTAETLSEPEDVTEGWQIWSGRDPSLSLWDGRHDVRSSDGEVVVGTGTCGCWLGVLSSAVAVDISSPMQMVTMLWSNQWQARTSVQMWFKIVSSPVNMIKNGAISVRSNRHMLSEIRHCCLPCIHVEVSKENS